MDDEPRKTLTIGSSDAPKILGVSPHGGPWQVWPELVGLVPRYAGTTSKTARRGKVIERLILDLYAEETGIEVAPGVDLLDKAPTRQGWAHSHPDGFGIEGANAERGYVADRVVEAKSIRKFGRQWGREGTDEVRLDYLVQSVMHTFVHRLPVDLVAFELWTSDLRIYRIEPSPALLSRVTDTLRAWWARHVRDGNPPPIDASRDCARGMALAYAYTGGKGERDATPEERDIARELRAIKDQIGTLSKQADRLSNDLLHRMHDTERLLVDGRKIASVSRFERMLAPSVDDVEELRRVAYVLGGALAGSHDLDDADIDSMLPDLLDALEAASPTVSDQQRLTLAKVVE